MARSALILLLVSTLGCVTKARRPRAETALQALNGENYELPAHGIPDHLLAPILRQKERSIEIRGKVLLQAGLGAVPVKGVELGLFTEDGRMLGSGSSGEGGEFSIPAPVRSGNYKLKTMGEKYKGQYPVKIDNYSVEGILLQVEKAD